MAILDAIEVDDLEVGMALKTGGFERVEREKPVEFGVSGYGSGEPVFVVAEKHVAFGLPLLVLVALEPVLLLAHGGGEQFKGFVTNLDVREDIASFGFFAARRIMHRQRRKIPPVADDYDHIWLVLHKGFGGPADMAKVVSWL